jgi:hypothetical protein
MRILNANSGSGLAGVLAGIAMFFAVSTAHATIASRTADALAANPNGGAGLVLAIADIFFEEGYDGKPEIIARAILAASEGATTEQMAALGRAMAAHADALAPSDPNAAAAIEAVVADAKSAQLKTSFYASRTGGKGKPPPVGLGVPAGGGAGGRGHLDVPSAN